LNNNFTLLPLGCGVNTIKSQEELDTHWEFWCDLVISTINESVPKVKCRNPNFPPWISKDLAKAIKKKKTLWKKVRKTTDVSLREKFRKERQRIKNWTRAERKRFFRDVANEAYSNPKKFWSVFSSKNRKKSIPDTIVYEGTEYSTDCAKAETFLRFFQSVYSDHGSCISPSVVESNPLSTETLNLIEVSTTEVTTLLEELDCSQAPGPDNIPTVVLKRCASALAPSITALFNCSFANGHFIAAWKTANICPVHKRENKADVTHYRPISLLPILSKIQEKCVLKRLLPHISEALFPMQHGFIKGLSCTTQLLQVFHEIGHNLDKGLETDIIYLDFPKAFDSVCHQKFLSKLLYFGIDGTLLKWFESYLSARKQRVVINGSYSSRSEVKSGVIQGSILGPVLFLMFVNDMPEVLRSSNLAMFADDSKCF